MNATQIAAYRAENARLRAEEATRPARDRDLIESHDKATRAALAVLADADHEQALIDDRARHPFLPTMGHGPAWGACQMIGCGLPYADASTHTRTILTATGVVTR